MPTHAVVAFWVLTLAPAAFGRAGSSPDEVERLRAPTPPVAEARTERGTAGGLPAEDWAGIRAAHERARHAAVPVEGGHRARNPAQAWRTCFDGRGFTAVPDAGGWIWGLELERFGFSGSERAVAEPARVKVDGGRVSYDWGSGLQEWYVNDRRGLEHGYTVHRRPAARDRGGEAGPLSLTLRVRGTLRPEPSADGRDVVFVDEDGAPVVTYTGLVVFDADGRELGAGFERTGDRLRLSVDERGARYPLTIDPVAQRAYCKASNTQALDLFGVSVAVSGDTVVVGALGEDSSATGVDGDESDNGAPQSGAAYVFVRNGTTWSQQAYLKASNCEAADQFGRSVAVSGDTVVVGARFESSNAIGVNGVESDNTAPRSGAAYVFVRNGTTWSQQAYLKASNTDAEDVFGIWVAVSGDTVVVGAPDEDGNATGVNGNGSDDSAPEAGAAYVFVRNGTTWSQEAYLKASNTDATDLFGRAVAVSGDTVVVGASGEASDATGVNGDQTDDSVPQAGAVYVFVRTGTTWSQEAYLKASNTDAGDLFGVSLAVSGDTAAVGARAEASGATGTNGNQGDDGAPEAGAVYVFGRSGTIWSQLAYLKASNTDVGDLFGGAVSASGDTVVVGAVFESSGATGVSGDENDDGAAAAGAAYVFSSSYPSSEIARLGTPANPHALLPGVTSGPVLGASWDPVIDHTSFAPGASVDVLALSLGAPINVLTAFGTLLCTPPTAPGLIFFAAPGLPFNIPIPAKCSLIARPACSQGVSFTPGSGFVLTNALDLVIGAQ